jgi:hypothetical protein
MSKVVKGARDPSGRDLVFEAWFEDNIARVDGGRVEQRSIYKAYRQFQRGDRALGEQGVERMLNHLKVQRQVRQGKTYRLGVGFKVAMPGVAGGVVETAGKLRVPIDADWGGASPASPVFDGSVSHGDPRDIRPGNIVTNEPTPQRKPGWLSGGWRYGAVVLEVAAANEAEAFGALALRDVYVERHRQVTEEGFDAAHDDGADPGAHERAAACYAFAAAQPDRLAPFVETSAKQPREGRLGWIVRETLILMWPWATQWWKPQTDAPDWKRRCLVKAGALILAAIERHDRNAARATLEASQAKDMTGV